MIADYVSEQALLASALRKPSEYSILSDIVSSEDFHWVCFGWAWSAMSRIIEKGMTIDAVTIGDELNRSGNLDEFFLPESKQFSGRAAIGKIKEISTSSSGMSYALIVRDYSDKRKIMETLRTGAKWCANGRTSGSIVSDIQNSLSGIGVSSGSREHVWEADRASVNALKATEIARLGGNDVRTGLIDLDAILAPQRTDFVVYAARPGQGKSALCATTALANAFEGKKTLLFTIEMGAVQVTQRLISQIANISAFQVMRGKLSAEAQEKYEQAAQSFAELKPYLLTVDKPAIRLSQLRLETRRWKPDVIVVDYVQLAEADKRNDRRDLDIGEVTRGLKALAKEMDACVFAAAQVGRGAEARADKEPTLADLRESGSIENDADSVVFVHHGDKVKFSQCSLQVKKHRNGPVGNVMAYFDEESISFRDAVKAFGWEQRADIS